MLGSPLPLLLTGFLAFMGILVETQISRGSKLTSIYDRKCDAYLSGSIKSSINFTSDRSSIRKQYPSLAKDDLLDFFHFQLGECNKLCITWEGDEPGLLH